MLLLGSNQFQSFLTAVGPMPKRFLRIWIRPPPSWRLIQSSLFSSHFGEVETHLDSCTSGMNIENDSNRWPWHIRSVSGFVSYQPMDGRRFTLVVLLFLDIFAFKICKHPLDIKLSTSTTCSWLMCKWDFKLNHPPNKTRQWLDDHTRASWHQQLTCWKQFEKYEEINGNKRKYEESRKSSCCLWYLRFEMFEHGTYLLATILCPRQFFCLYFFLAPWQSGKHGAGFAWS